MRATWTWAGLTLRRRLLGTVALVVVLGVSGGVVLGAAAGSRRTATALPRLLAETRSDVVLVSGYGPGLKTFYEDVRKQLRDAIADSGLIAAVSVSPVTASGEAPLIDGVAQVAVDGRVGFDIAGFKLVAGRLPHKENPFEILAPDDIARAQRWRVGQKVPMRLFRNSAPPKDPHHIVPNEGVPIDLTITGIGIFPESIVPVTSSGANGAIVLTPAFWARYGDVDDTAYDGLYVILKPGVNGQRFRADALAVGAKHPEIGGNAFFAFTSEQHVRARRAVQPQAAALGVFAIIAGLVTLLVLGQAITRQLALDAEEIPIARAIGLTRRQLVTAALLRVGAVASAGAALAVFVAIAASPAMPIGPARIAEPHPGIAVNVAILGIGAAVMIAAFLGWSFIPAWRAATPRWNADRGHRSTVADAVSRAGLDTPAIGIRMALEPGRGKTSVPVRSAVAGTALAVAALTASLVFGASLDRLVGDPHAFGWNWDTMLDSSFGIISTPTLDQLLDPGRIDAWSGGIYGEVTVNGKSVPAVGLDARRGELFPTLLRGRPARAEGEIVLGPRTMRDARTRIGDMIDVGIASGDGSAAPRKMRVVGEAVFPSLGRGGFTPTGLGDGAYLVARPLAQAAFGAQQQGQKPGDGYNFALVRFRPGHAPDPGALQKALLATTACADQECGVLRGVERRPADLQNYERVRGTQLALAGMLFLLASLTVGHTLVTAVRRRSADLAVLKTLGSSRRQVSSIVAWQATTYAVFACAIGVPGGVVLGRWAWAAFAGQLGVPGFARVTLVAILLPIGATLALANVAAAAPARTAGRVSPAAVLRAE